MQPGTRAMLISCTIPASAPRAACACEVTDATEHQRAGQHRHRAAARLVSGARSASDRAARVPAPQVARLAIAGASAGLACRSTRTRQFHQVARVIRRRHAAIQHPVVASALAFLPQLPRAAHIIGWNQYRQQAACATICASDRTARRAPSRASAPRAADPPAIRARVRQQHHGADAHVIGTAASADSSTRTARLMPVPPAPAPLPPPHALPAARRSPSAPSATRPP